jgi:hypothetical protein
MLVGADGGSTQTAMIHNTALLVELIKKMVKIRKEMNEHISGDAR